MCACSLFRMMVDEGRRQVHYDWYGTMLKGRMQKENRRGVVVYDDKNETK